MNRIFNKIGPTLLIVSFLCGLYSCSDEDEPVKKPEKTLVDTIELGTYRAEELNQLVALSGVDVPPGTVKYDVKVYKVTYRTPYKDDEVTASGLVVLPQTTDALSMLSVHHGTIIAHDDAPTEQAFLDQDMLLYAMLGSTGLITVVPDYLGFGSTSNLVHPYYVEDVTASSVIDNLEAAGELAADKDITFNKNLFLVGYSEGGYVTMAVHKYLDENQTDDFQLVASFPAAGGYDLKQMQEYVFGLETYSDPFYIPYLAYAYKTTSDWTEPLTDWFNEPYASAIPGLFNGTASGSEINAALNDTIPVLISNDLLVNIDTDPKYEYIVHALEENSLTDWVPVTPMYMYHGDADTTVPYANSQVVYEQLLANGASPDVVHFITLPGADHGSGLMPYIEDVIPKIMSLNL